jgi:general secretion pathway protein L
MIRKIVGFWSWFVGGLTDAAIGCASMLSKQQSVELVVANGQAVLREERGRKIGRITRLTQPIVADPPDLSERLKKARLDVVVPENLVLHRKLNPLSEESAPFMDAFVRHQIERVTPWKAADTYFGVSTTKMAGKPAKIGVSVHVVPRRLLEDVVTAARALHPARLRLVVPTQADGTVSVPIDDGAKAQRTKIRAIIQAATASIILLLVCRLALFPAQIATVQSQTADVDSQIEDQESALAASREGTGHFAAGDLLALRQARPRVVETLEDLSAALPDDDYLTSLQVSDDQLHVSGISTRTSDLVPALEGSGHFRDVSFVEPITRVQTGDGNKFHLLMRIVAPGKAMQR